MGIIYDKGSGGILKIARTQNMPSLRNKFNTPLNFQSENETPLEKLNPLPKS